MNMAAPSGVMTIGADVSSTRMTAEDKPVDAGKTFAASLDERIAADEVAAVKNGVETNASQVRAGMQAPVNGVAQDVGHEPVAAVNTLQAADVEAQGASTLLTKGAAISSALPQQMGIDAAGDKAPVVPTVVTAQGMPAKSTDDGQDSDAVLQAPGDTDVKPSAAAVAAQDAMAYVGSEQPHGAKMTPTVEMPQAAQNGTSASATVAGVKAQAIHPLQELAGSTKNVSADRGEKVASAKGTAKKHASAKAEASTKTVESGTSLGVFPGSIHGVVEAGVAVNPVASTTVQAAAAQATAAQSASRQGATVAAMTGAQVASAAGGHASVMPSRSLEKAHGDGVRASSQAETGAHVVQKDVQAPAKTGDPSVVAAAVSSATQAVKLSTKVQTADVAAAVSHPAVVAGAAANAAGTNPVLQIPATAVQKSVSEDGAATLLAAHSGNGELPGAPGTQAAMGETHRTLVATPTVLEVGIPNGTQGWLKVRAELTGGGVNASLSAASSAGQEMLHRELPALTTYLQQEKVAVNSLIVQAPVTGGFCGPSAGTGSFTGGQMQQQNQGGSGRETFAGADRAGLMDSGVSGADEPSAALQYPGGGWLSVRA